MSQKSKAIEDHLETQARKITARLRRCGFEVTRQGLDLTLHTPRWQMRCYFDPRDRQWRTVPQVFGVPAIIREVTHHV